MYNVFQGKRQAWQRLPRHLPTSSKFYYTFCNGSAHAERECFDEEPCFGLATRRAATSEPALRPPQTEDHGSPLLLVGSEVPAVVGEVVVPPSDRPPQPPEGHRSGLELLGRRCIKPLPQAGPPPFHGIQVGVILWVVRDNVETCAV